MTCERMLQMMEAPVWSAKEGSVLINAGVYICVMLIENTSVFQGNQEFDHQDAHISENSKTLNFLASFIERCLKKDCTNGKLLSINRTTLKENISTKIRHLQPTTCNRWPATPKHLLINGFCFQINIRESIR